VTSRYRAKFRAILTLQVILLTATISVLVYSFLVADLLVVPLIAAAVAVLQVVGILAHVESHVDSLNRFFAAIDYEDFTCRFVENGVDAELKQAFNGILKKFQTTRAERDLQANYLETVVRHVPIPFMAARGDGSLSLVNHPARQLMGIPTLRHMHELATLDIGLPEQMQAIQAGQRKLLQTTIQDMPAELRISVSEIRLQGKAERLYTLENLSGELTAREASAWRNLIRVLTHEIMNTLTPVTSLAHSCRSLITESDASEDVRDAMSTIARRSERLMDFVSHYRRLLRVPEPQLQRFQIQDFFANIVILMGTELGGTAVSIEVTPETLELNADQSLLDQVLLNLLRNAVEALRDTKDPQIELVARLSYGRILITVRDNGPGISTNVIDQVFVPFFTTKRDGSGIGLSLSRQILTAHGGEIAVSSNSSGTTVSLVF